MKVIQLIKATFCPVANDLKLIENDLSSLEKEMEAISKMNNKVEAMVRLFKFITPLQDKGVLRNVITKLQQKNYGQLDRMIHEFESLQSYFYNTTTRRSPYSTNRTKDGEEVTSKTIWIGAVCGLNTMSAEYWITNQTKLMSDWHPDYENTWNAINGYCDDEITAITNGILKQILTLKKVA
jgi:hypothetical protein